MTGSYPLFWNAEGANLDICSWVYAHPSYRARSRRGKAQRCGRDHAEEAKEAEETEETEEMHALVR